MVQIVEMTQEEKVEMYNKVSKNKLVEMLIEANKHLDRINTDVKLTEPVVNSTFTEYEKQVSINCIELIAQNKDKYILDEGVLYLVELVEKYTIVPINQP